MNTFKQVNAYIICEQCEFKILMHDDYQKIIKEHHCLKEVKENKGNYQPNKIEHSKDQNQNINIQRIDEESYDSSSFNIEIYNSNDDLLFLSKTS